jgi:hypothetical protein
MSRQTAAEPSAPPDCSTLGEALRKATDIARVEAYLRMVLGSDRIHIDEPNSRGASVEVRAGREFLGTLHRDDQDGEVSFPLHITILEDDLPVALPRQLAAL